MSPPRCSQFLCPYLLPSVCFTPKPPKRWAARLGAWVFFFAYRWLPCDHGPCCTLGLHPALCVRRARPVRVLYNPEAASFARCYLSVFFILHPHPRPCGRVGVITIPTEAQVRARTALAATLKVSALVMVRELSLAPIHPDCNKRCRIRLNHFGDALLLGRESETPPGEEFDSGITSKFVHRKHVRIEGEPPVLTALGMQPCIVINSEGRLKLTEGETCVLNCVDTYTPELVLYVRPPACSYPRHRAACRRARVPASGVPTACCAVTPCRGGPGSARARRDPPHRRGAREQYHPLRVRDRVFGRRVRVPRRLRRTLPAPADRTRRPSLPQAEADADTRGQG